MKPKPFKFIRFLVLASVIGLIGFIVIGFTFFSYKETTLTAGCEQEFCMQQTKAEIAVLFEGKYSFKRGTMIPYDPTIKPDQYISANHANSIAEMVETDRWTVIYDRHYGWRKFVHLSFRDEVLYQIKVVNYGPFYIDP